MRWVFALFLCAVCAAQTPAYHVAGVVVNSVTGAPLGKTKMTLRNISAPNNQSVVVTAPDGRFSFDVPQGHYSLSAERHGQDRQYYGQRTLRSNYWIGVFVGPDHPVEPITFRMIPNAALSGRILDEAGDPVENAMVQLFRSTVSSGTRTVYRYNYAYSDDRGEYRFSRLAAGDYYVAASGQPWYSNSPMYPLAAGQADDGRVMSYPLTFSPNARDWHSASVIHVHAGDDAAAGVSLVATPGYRLTVKCEPAVKSTRVTVVGDTFMGAEGLVKIEWAYCPESVVGVFAPGTYLLRSWLGSGVNSNPLTGRQTVQISAADVAVHMDFKPAPTVSGKILPDHVQPAPSIVMLRPMEGGISASRTVEADGSFSFPNTVPGTYRLMIREPAGVWAKQVSADGKPLAAGTFEVTEDHAPQLLVTPGRGLAHLQGSVMKDGRPTAGMLVVLAPVNPSGDVAEYGVDQSNSDGSFEMKDVRPGDYYLLAADTDELEYANRTALQPYLERAAKLHVEEGREYKQEVTVQ